MVAHAVPVEACPAIQPYRWTRAEFDKLGLADIFHPDARVELIDGEILAMAPLTPLEATAIQLVQTLLRDHCGNGFMVSTQLSLAISYSTKQTFYATDVVPPLSLSAVALAMVDLLP